MQKIALFFIFMYKKFISPLIPHSCRFVPSCSDYAYQAIDRYGFICGVFLAIKRIFRCNPFGGCGVDKVPE